jgi:hypothetical protein
MPQIIEEQELEDDTAAEWRHNAEQVARLAGCLPTLRVIFRIPLRRQHRQSQPHFRLRYDLLRAVASDGAGGPHNPWVSNHHIGTPLISRGRLRPTIDGSIKMQGIGCA